MIDCENIIFNTIATAIRAVHGTVFVSGEYVDSPASFPAVTIVEQDNSVYVKMSTTELENHAEVMYECNVYSNKVSGKKSEAKAIADTVDTAFKGMGFTRKLKQPIPNLQDSKIYRITMRYEGIIDRENFVYQS